MAVFLLLKFERKFPADLFPIFEKQLPSDFGTQPGCQLTGLIEINSHYKAFMSDEYEKAHGYLFRI